MESDNGSSVSPSQSALLLPPLPAVSSLSNLSAANIPQTQQHSLLFDLPSVPSNSVGYTASLPASMIPPSPNQITNDFQQPANTSLLGNQASNPFLTSATSTNHASESSLSLASLSHALPSVQSHASPVLLPAYSASAHATPSSSLPVFQQPLSSPQSGTQSPSLLMPSNAIAGSHSTSTHCSTQASPFPSTPSSPFLNSQSSNVLNNNSNTSNSSASSSGSLLQANPFMLPPLSPSYQQQPNPFVGTQLNTSLLHSNASSLTAPNPFLLSPSNPQLPNYSYSLPPINNNNNTATQPVQASGQANPFFPTPAQSNATNATSLQQPTLFNSYYSDLSLYPQAIDALQKPVNASEIVHYYPTELRDANNTNSTTTSNMNSSNSSFSNSTSPSSSSGSFVLQYPQQAPKLTQQSPSPVQSISFQPVPQVQQVSQLSQSQPSPQKQSQGGTTSSIQNYFQLNPHLKGGFLESIGNHIGTQVEAHIDEKERMFEKGIDEWGRWEANILNETKIPPKAARIVTVRHGMGAHNETFIGAFEGLGTFVHYDPSLNELGLKQSPALGRFLLQNTALFADESLLIVVSPFKRTLQTLLGIMEAFGPAQWKYRTIIQPMCGEYYKGVGGDVGTNRAGLEQIYPRSEYPAFDFSTLDNYCAQWDHTRQDGSWWTHGTSLPLFETLTIQQRCAAFRTWLANTCVELQARQVLLVSHGGILKYAFPVPKSPKYENCEIKTFDLYPNGQYRRCIPLLTAEAHFSIDLTISSVRAIDYNTCTHFEIVGRACGVEFVKTIERMSDLKENVYKLIPGDILRTRFKTSFPVKTTVSSYGGFFQTSSYNWSNLKPWLNELSVVLNENVLSNEVKYNIVAYLLERW